MLEDGTLFPGRSFGSPAPQVNQLPENTQFDAAGEIVFNTSMTGYHEILSDPSYTGQIVVMTYPHIGNYGCDPSWNEAHPATSPRQFFSSALVVRSWYDGPIPPDRIPLADMMHAEGITGITDVDTRSLTLTIREHGSCNALVFSPAGAEATEEEIEAARAWLQSVPPMIGRNLAGSAGIGSPEVLNPKGSPHMAVIDCGIKEQILRELIKRNVKVTLMPASATARDIRSLQSDACLISNGPGDPSVLTSQIETARELSGTMPLFGICLGTQLIALALGGSTYKMEFGHHGGNHPVRDAETGKTFVTSQNHGFAVDPAKLPKSMSLWFTNANDQSVEGLKHDTLPICCVQFHPEAAPGPQDSSWIFDRFLAVTEAHKQ